MRTGCRITLLREIMLKHAVINVKIDGQYVLRMVSVHRSTLREDRKYSERKLLYSHYMTVLNIDDIEFPTLKNIGKFECLNNVSINI